MAAELEYAMNEEGMRKKWEDLWSACSWYHWEMKENKKTKRKEPRRQLRIASRKNVIEVEERNGHWFVSHLLAYVGRPTSSCSCSFLVTHILLEMKRLVEAWPKAMPTDRRKNVTSRNPQPNASCMRDHDC